MRSRPRAVEECGRTAQFPPMRILLVGLAVLPAFATAQTPPVSSYDGLRWESVGPLRAGRALAIAGSERRPHEYYAGLAGGGLWKTADGGTTWGPVTDGQIASAAVGAVAVAPSDPDVVYLGTGDPQWRGDHRTGDGVYRSSDGGRTWVHRGLPNAQTIARIRVHPQDPDRVFVAVLGRPSEPSVERGVYRSRDGGVTWQQVLFRSDSAGAIDLAIDPTDPEVLYAATWQVSRRPWRLWGGGQFSGLFKSSDGGETWVDISRQPGLPRGYLGRIGITVSPVDGRRLYAIIEAEDGGVFISDDAGASWRKGSDVRALRQRPMYFSRIVADGLVKDRVYVLNAALWRSDDAGVRFAEVPGGPEGDHQDLWVSARDSGRLGRATSGGAGVSVTAGATWTAMRAATAQVHRVVATQDTPYHICGAQQDRTTFCTPSSVRAPGTPPGGSLGEWVYGVGGGQGGYVAPDPRQPDVFFAGGEAGLLTQYDRRTGALRDVQVYPRVFSGEPAYAIPERWSWSFPLVHSPVAKGWLFAGSQHIWRSKNDGQFWERISDDLTRADTATLGFSGGPLTMDMGGTELYGTVSAIAPSRFDSLTIWAGSDDGLVHITRDGGGTWRRITPPDLPPHSRIAMIEASARERGAALMAVTRMGLGEHAPYLYRTRDYGATWTRLDGALTATEVAHVIREDPVRRGLLFVGTESGVRLSFDDGATWQSLSLNLPVAPVVDLIIAGQDVVIATYGRGVWVLRDITPLREASSSTAAKRAHLYAPRVAVRRVQEARIQYHLATDASRVSINIHDSTGAFVRGWTGAPTPASTAPVPGCDAPTRPTLTPSSRAGMHALTWDLRAEGALTFPCMIVRGAEPALGPVVPPGRYTVELDVDGVRERRPVIVARDERNPNADLSDLRAQYVFARRVLEQEDRVTGTVLRVRALRASVEQRRLLAGDAVAIALADTALLALWSIEEQLYQWRSRSPLDLLNFPIRLGNRLHALRQSIELGDGRPTDVSYIVLRGLTDDVARVVSALASVEGGALTRLDARLRALGQRPIDRAFSP